MRITEGSINHNAVRLIDKIIENPLDYIEECKNGDFMEIIGEVRGVFLVLLIAEAMKEVLKS